MKIKDVFLMAYNMEVSGMEFYDSQKAKVKSKILKDIFDHLSKMEKGHALFLKTQIENIEQNKGVEQLPDAKDDSIFIERIKQQKIDTATLEDDLGDFSIIRMAYLIEKDFEEFYRKSSEKADEKDIKDIFNGLAEWEKGHAEMLKGRLEEIIERNSIELGFYPL